MRGDFFLKRGDTRPWMDATLTDRQGEPVDISGNTQVRFIMRNLATDEVQIDQTDSNIVEVIDAAVGEVRYRWQAGDTDVVGDFKAEFEVTFNDDSVETFPNGSYIFVVIRGDIEELPPVTVEVGSPDALVEPGSVTTGGGV